MIIMEDAGKEITERKTAVKEKIMNWLKDPYNKVFLLMLIAAFVIRFWIFLRTTGQPLWWDGADYMSAAKRWGLGLNINDIWYYRRGFLFPLVGALFFKFGFGETGIRFVILLMSTGIIALSYALIKDMFNKQLALLTSICLAVSWIFLFFTGRVLTDIPAAFLILLSLLFFWKGYVLKKGNKYLYWFGAFFAVTVLTRMQMLMFAPAFLAVIFMKEKFKFLKNKSLWITLGIFALILLPQAILYTSHYGNPITDILSHYFGIKAGSQAAPNDTNLAKSLNYFLNLPYIMNPWMFYLLILGILFFFADMVLGFDKLFSNEDIQKKVFIFLWIVIPFLVLGYITEYVEQRYVSACLPFLFMIAIYPLSYVEQYASKFINKKAAAVLIVIVLISLLIPNFTSGNSLIEQKKTSYLEVKQAGEWIKANSNPSDIVLTLSLPQIMYYSERSTYPLDVNGICDRDSSTCKYQDGAAGLDEFVKEKKPKYLMLSIFEKHLDWEYAYPQEHNDTLVPVQAWFSDQQKTQPALVIYEFKYKSEVPEFSNVTNSQKINLSV